MQKRTLPRLAGAGWAHPYGHAPFAPYLYADGGDGDDSGSGSDDSGDEGGAGGQDDDAGGTGGDDTGADDGGKGEKPKPKPPAKKDEDPAAELERLRKELKQANGEAAKARTSAKKAAADEARAEIMKELGKVLGLVEDDDKTPPDPAALKAQIESATAAHKSTAIELAVYRGAGKAGVDPDAITDSRAFMKSIEDLDPTDEGFAKAVTAAMKKAAEDNPKLKAASQAPARTSSDFSGSTEKPASKNSIEAQREARRKARQG
ncbi:hypothetical protein ACWDBT_27550 [Streptomyces ardesiacus]